MAERRPGRAAAPRPAATSPRSSTPPARRSSSCATPTARSAPSTTSAATAATSWCGTTTPREETSGTCRQFTCKYHGWRYGLEGELTFVQQESEFFDLDKADYGLVPVQVEVWEGFIFVNLDPDNTDAAARVPRRARRRPRGLPVRRDDAGHKYRAEVGSNWKLFIDAFAEFYHAPVLHAKQAVAEESRKLQGYGFEALAYELDGPHGMVSSWGGMSPPKDLEHGEADRAGAAQRPVRPVGRAPTSGSTSCRRRSTRPATRRGASTRSLLPELHAAGLGAELVPHVPLLADVLQHATSSRARCTSCRRRTPASGCSRSWRR